MVVSLDGQPILREFHPVRVDQRTIEDWSKQYGFDIALTEAGSQYHNYLPPAPGWRLVKQKAAGSLSRKLSE
jgi:hypothetical protein